METAHCIDIPHRRLCPCPALFWPLSPPPNCARCAACARTPSLTPAERDRVEVILRSHQGETLPELAADLGYRYDTVRLWRQAWTAQGVDFVCHRPPGPPLDKGIC